MKKMIPLELREAIDEFAMVNDNLFQVIIGDNPIVVFKDVDPDSNFCFQIDKVQLTDKGETVYKFQFLPSGSGHMLEYRGLSKLEVVKAKLVMWRTLMVRANSPSPVFDDPFAQKYYDDIEPNFTILDEDADYSPYSIVNQEKIITFLERAKEILTEKADNDSDAAEAIEIIQETTEALSRSTKKQVVSKIRMIIAKGFKVGMNVGKALLIEFTTELAKKLLLG